METAEFDYSLPAELIAQAPCAQRDQSRLLVLHRRTGLIEHRVFRDVLDYVVGGDVLVLNDSRVIPARLIGRAAGTGGKFEILLLEELERNLWQALVRPGRRARIGTQIIISSNSPCEIAAEIVGKTAAGQYTVQFKNVPNILSVLDSVGEVPLPPYIRRPGGKTTDEDRKRYQTVYARKNGSVAAPTAGLHFTEELLEQIRAKGVEVRFVTLHVGVGTFAPVRASKVEAHRMHSERYEISAETAEAICAAKKDGRRIIAVGTTTVRVLESVALDNGGMVRAGAGRTSLFIYPPFKFRVVDALITNFHLPRSTLLMLVSAFAAPGETTGRELILRAYQEAIALRYRFYSYGDAMLIV
ncbi:MAG: tRNA preQ1(34) S-adenosylmethionine ribosyltransferase-isomerase QueA [Verrucomicrobiales bacterium]|nr:tRNA preQ1(34) S-adenosylmethionine ribosyltransferase-isomerase QueA [Verrucomicrobiales bacterium]